MPTDLLSYSACLYVPSKVFLNTIKYHHVFKDRIMVRSWGFFIWTRSMQPTSFWLWLPCTVSLTYAKYITLCLLNNLLFISFFFSYLWYFFTSELPWYIYFQDAVDFPRTVKMQPSVRLSLHLPVIGGFHSLPSVFNNYGANHTSCWDAVRLLPGYCDSWK